MEQLRATVGVPNLISGIQQRQLDFEAHLLPLIQLEMGLIFYSALYGEPFRRLAIDAAQPGYEKFLADVDAFATDGEAGEVLLSPVAAIAVPMLWQSTMLASSPPYTNPGKAVCCGFGTK